MPKRKIRGKVAKKQSYKEKNITFSNLRQMISSIRWTESYTGLLMGIVAVIVGVLFVVSFLRNTHHIQETTSTNTTASPMPISGSSTSEFKQAQQTYTVQKGDDLWHIAEKFYKSGYNYVDIAKANSLSNPSLVFSGDKLVIPSVEPKAITINTSTNPGSSTHSITSDTYTVQKGDNLWEISVRAYADGYQWVKIAKANNLTNPGLIFSGNMLKIPR